MDDERELEDLGGVFIGSNQSYEKFKKQHNLTDEEDENSGETNSQEKESSDKPSTKTVLSKNTLTKIDDETMTILRRTRCAHKYTEVFMQSSLEFYDQYYNDNEASPELKAARQIRRIYTSYTDYLNAMKIRNAYIDTLIEKYGEDVFMQKLSMGLIRDWIPPIPTMSKRSPDYEMFVTGMIPVKTKTLPEGTTRKVLEAMQEDVEGVEIERSSDVETSIGRINAIERMLDEEYSGGYRKTTKIESLEELNRVFKSWYKTDNADKKHEMFKNAPENIKRRYEENLGFSEPGLLSRLASGEEIKEAEPSMNEMVQDEVTGRSMTRREYLSRQTIRMLARTNGWSESRLLAYSNVGSSLERMSRKKKANKKRRRNDSNETGGDIQMMYGNMMNAPEGIDPMYCDDENLVDALTSLMRGD